MLKLNGVKVEFERYANGELCLKEKFLESINGLQLEDQNEVTWFYEGDGDFLQISVLKDTLDEMTVGTETSFNLRITYLPYSRMDRGEGKYPFVLKSVSKIIKSWGFDYIDVVECHSGVGIELLDANQVLLNKELLSKVKDEINFLTDFDHIVYPDKGARLRYTEALGEGLVCDKVRDFDSTKIKALELVDKDKLKINKNAKAIIVDDLCSYGNTFNLAAKELRAVGFKEVYLLVCHAEDNIFKGNLLTDNLIDRVFTTDSILSKLKIFSL